MRSGRGGWHWYILIGFVAVIVYPDRVLDWVGDRLGRVFDWRHIVVLEVVTVALMFVTMSVLASIDPRLDWWHPVLGVGALGLLRGFTWFLAELFGVQD